MRGRRSAKVEEFVVSGWRRVIAPDPAPLYLYCMLQKHAGPDLHPPGRAVRHLQGSPHSKSGNTSGPRTDRHQPSQRPAPDRSSPPPLPGRGSNIHQRRPVGRRTRPERTSSGVSFLFCNFCPNFSPKPLNASTKKNSLLSHNQLLDLTSSLVAVLSRHPSKVKASSEI